MEKREEERSGVNWSLSSPLVLGHEYLSLPPLLSPPLTPSVSPCP